MSTADVVAQRAAMPHGTEAILATRSLATSHRRLAELLSPGVSVLDVGCGTGAITRDIPRALRSHVVRVVGVDVNAAFIEEARRQHAGAAGLTFEVADAYTLPFRDEFDLVSAARLFQWLRRPADALRAMTAAIRTGGRVVVLDYNHHKLEWEPAPPASMQRFYAAFLAWRAEAGMDNAIADRLHALLRAAGLADVTVTAQHETVRRGDPDFAVRAGIWADVAATRGHQMVADGAIDEATRAAAEADYRAWVAADAIRHTMYLLAVDGAR